MGQSSYLSQLNAIEKMSEPWPEKAILYQPYEAEQILLPEHASCLAVKAYLKMCNLPFEICSRENAEFMSPGGRMTKLPILRAGQFTLAEFEQIVTFVDTKKAGVGQKLNDDDRDDMRSHVSLVENIFTMAEIYISFVNDDVYKQVTAPRYGYVFPWPLNILQNMSKRRQALRILKVYQWNNITIEKVIENIEKCCESLRLKLDQSEGDYFYSEGPSDLDAIVFGHLYTILTTKLPNMALAQTVQKFKSLVKFCQFIDAEYFQKKSNN